MFCCSAMMGNRLIALSCIRKIVFYANTICSYEQIQFHIKDVT